MLGPVHRLKVLPEATLVPRRNGISGLPVPARRSLDISLDPKKDHQVDRPFCGVPATILIFCNGNREPSEGYSTSRPLHPDFLRVLGR